MDFDTSWYISNVTTHITCSVVSEPAGGLGENGLHVILLSAACIYNDMTECECKDFDILHVRILSSAGLSQSLSSTKYCTKNCYMYVCCPQANDHAQRHDNY